VTDLAIIDSVEELHHFVKNRPNQVEQLHVVATTPSAALEARNLGVTAESIEAHKDLGWVSKINQIAKELSQGWWRSASLRGASPPLSSYLDTEFGKVFELSFVHVIAEAARAVMMAEKLIEATQPRQVWLYEPAHSLSGGLWVGISVNLRARAIALVVEEAGITVRRLSLPRSPRALVGRLPGVRLLKRTLQHLRKPRDESVHHAPPQPLVLSTLENCKRVLVYAEGRHNHDLIPLILELQRNSDIEVIAVSQDMPETCMTILRDERVTLCDPSTYDSVDLRREVGEVADSVAAKWSEIRDDPGLNDLGREHVGISLWPLTKFQFRWLFAEGFSYAARRGRLALATLEHLQPDVILSTVDCSLHDLCWILPGQSLDIPCITQLHGARYITPASHVWNLGSYDKTAVWGSLTAAWHTEATGRPAEDFVLAGFPVFETSKQRYDSTDVDEVRTALGLDAAKPVLLFLVSLVEGCFASYFQSELAIYDAFFSGVRKIPNVQTVIRAHPGANRQFLEQYVLQVSTPCWLNPESELLPLIKAADVIIGQPTTALVEAMIVKKPVVLFNASLAPDLAWWLEHSDLCSVDRSEELSDLVQSILTNQRRRATLIAAQNRFLDILAGPIDGRSCQRIIRLIETAAYGKSPSP